MTSNIMPSAGPTDIGFRIVYDLHSHFHAAALKHQAIIMFAFEFSE
jgi:hypothetical protein